MLSDRPLEDYPELWGILLRRLSHGLDVEHDAKIVKSFAEYFHVSPRYVTARMLVYIHSSRTMH
jgi:hypothetical protein